MPPSAASSRPALAATAPVNAPRSWPNSSLSSSDSESAAQLSRSKGRACEASGGGPLGEHLLADARLAEQEHVDVARATRSTSASSCCIIGFVTTIFAGSDPLCMTPARVISSAAVRPSCGKLATLARTSMPASPSLATSLRTTLRACTGPRSSNMSSCSPGAKRATMSSLRTWHTSVRSSSASVPASSATSRTAASVPPSRAARAHSASRRASNASWLHTRRSSEDGNLGCTTTTTEPSSIVSPMRISHTSPGASRRPPTTVPLCAPRSSMRIGGARCRIAWRREIEGSSI